MAVLFITHKHPPATGGMEQQSFKLISGYKLLDETFEVTYDRSESIFLFFAKLRYRVKKILLSHPQITTIHLNDGLMAAFFILLKVDPMGRKLAVTFHGLDVVFPLSIYQKKILPLLTKRLDCFICVSEATKNECIKRNFPFEKLTVIKNGVDISPKAAPANLHIKVKGVDTETDKILLAIGRPVKRKGFSWFAKEVMPLLDESYKFVHIGQINQQMPFFYPFLTKRISNLYDLFTGRANDSTDLINAAKIPGNKTILAGRLTDEKRDLLLQKASFIVMPNIKQYGDMEGFGLVALEGAVLGKIVLAASIEGITDAIQDKKNGYLVPSGEPNSWVEIIHRQQTTDTSSTSFKEFTIQNYSWSKMVQGYETIFSEFKAK